MLRAYLIPQQALYRKPLGMHTPMDEYKGQRRRKPAVHTLPPIWSRRVSSPEVLATPRSQRTASPRRSRSLPELLTSSLPSRRSHDHSGSSPDPPVSSRSSLSGRSIEADTNHAGLRAATIEEQRFERMIERFQLRRVPSVVPSSLTSGVPGSSSRHNSRDHFTANSTTRRNSRRSISAHTMAIPIPSRHVSKKTAAWVVARETLHLIYHRLVFAALDVMARTTIPLPSTSGAACTRTRARMFVLSVAFTAKLLFTPFTIAYYLGPHDWSTVLDAVVNGIFAINIMGTCNTETVDSKRRLLTSRRAIWRHYRRDGFLLDLLAATPLECVLLIGRQSSGAHWIVGLTKLTIQTVSVRRHLRVFYAAWVKHAMSGDKHATGSAWLLFSRYSHLLRIGRIVVFIMLVAHYFACVWSWLQLDTDRDLFGSQDVLHTHINSLYVSLQLMQGQGTDAKTPTQALFGSAALLLGSISLAIMFANIAILVSNFNANDTAYQRKMEQVFSVMGKLELPHPIRERVHQYYEHLHVEYESLDGEVVKFAKDLSHTLQLEVVLFKYMDVLMQVPHWRRCSPDFQKQLVLSLKVRIYLPDDFIMRRGEVGTECYLINRGVCTLYEYPTGGYEPATMATMLNDVGYDRRSLAPATARAQTEVDTLHDGIYSRISGLTRGQSIGDLALLANYERTCDLRATTHVEMCVIERKSFQWLLTRYPSDRKVVVTSIVHHVMVSRDDQNLPCMLRSIVQDAAPQASVDEAVKLVVQKMDPLQDDPSIVFGVTGPLLSRIKEVVKNEHRDESDAAIITPPVSTEPPPSNRSSETVQDVLRDIQNTLTRLETRGNRWELPPPRRRSRRRTEPAR